MAGEPIEPRTQDLREKPLDKKRGFEQGARTKDLEEGGPDEAVEVSYATHARQEDLRARIDAQDLPVKRDFAKLTDALARAQKEGKGILLLQGETGSGKSIYSPLALREALRQMSITPENMIVMQPRRDAASGIARAVAAVARETLGRDVGISTSELKLLDPKTPIKIVTSGIFLRYLQEGRCNKDEVGALMLDEIHEGSLEYHLCLGLLKILHEQGNAPLVLLTSATVNKERIQKFFGIDAEAYLRIEGRTYPVEKQYLQTSESLAEDARSKNYIAQVACKVQEAYRAADKGDILTFMPGAREISDVIMRLKGTIPDADILPLHGSLGPADRDKALFRDHSLPDPARRRIIVATNIAETSLTVPGIGIVVDSCRQRSIRYNPKSGIIERGTEFISKDQAEQRAGRAGRTQEGVCYRVITQERFDNLPQHPDSEIRRVHLSRLVLTLKGLNLDPEHFPYIEAPDMESIHRGVEELRRLGALDDTGNLNRIGQEMKTLPFEPRISRILVEAKQRGCFLPALTLAVLDREGSIISSPTLHDVERAPGYDETAKRRNARQGIQRLHERFNHAGSDMLRDLLIFREALDHGLIEAMRRDHSPEGIEARKTFSRWSKENYISAEGLTHSAYRLQEFAREAGARVDIQELKKQLVNIEESEELNAVILAGHPDRILYRAFQGRGLSGYYRLGDSVSNLATTALNLSPDSAAFSTEPLLCIMGGNPREGAGTFKGKTISRVYASRIHPITPKQLQAMFPHLIAEREVGTSYNPQSDAVETSVQISLANRGGVDLTKETREVHGERAAAVFARALAEGKVDLPCVQENRDILTRLRELNARTGGREPQIPDMSAWYRSRLGEVANRAKAEAIQDQLRLPSDDLCPPELEESINARYPKTISIKGSGYPIAYTYQQENPSYGVKREYKATLALAPETIFGINQDDVPFIGTPDNHPEIVFSLRIGNGMVSDRTIETLKAKLDAYTVAQDWSFWKEKHLREIVAFGKDGSLPSIASLGKMPLAYAHDHKGTPIFSYPAIQYGEEAIAATGTREPRYYVEYFPNKEKAEIVQRQAEEKKAENEQKERRRIEREQFLTPAAQLLDETEELITRIAGDSGLRRQYGISTNALHEWRYTKLPLLRALLKDAYGKIKPDAESKKTFELLTETKESMEKRKAQIEERMQLVPDILPLRDNVAQLVAEKLSPYDYSEYGFVEAEYERLKKMWERANALLRTEDGTGEFTLPNPREAEALLNELQASLVYAKRGGDSIGSGMLAEALMRAQSQKERSPLELHDRSAPPLTPPLEVKNPREDNSEDQTQEAHEIPLDDEQKTRLLSELEVVYGILDGAKGLGAKPKNANNTSTRDKNLWTLYERIGGIRKDIALLKSEIERGMGNVISLRGKVQEMYTRTRSAYKRALGIIPDYDTAWVDEYMRLWEAIPQAVDVHADAREFIETGLAPRSEIIVRARQKLSEKIPAFQKSEAREVNTTIEEALNEF